MKNIRISIIKSSVIRDVSLSTAYTAAKAEQENGIFDRVATVEADEDLLAKFFEDSSGEITDLLKQYIVASEHSGEEITLELEVSGAYDEMLTPSLKNDIYSAMVARVIGRWLEYVYPKRSNEYAEKSLSLHNRILSKLCHRQRPVRKL